MKRILVLSYTVLALTSLTMSYNSYGMLEDFKVALHEYCFAPDCQMPLNDLISLYRKLNETELIEAQQIAESFDFPISVLAVKILNHQDTSFLEEPEKKDKGKELERSALDVFLLQLGCLQIDKKISCENLIALYRNLSYDEQQQAEIFIEITLGISMGIFIEEHHLRNNVSQALNLQTITQSVSASQNGLFSLLLKNKKQGIPVNLEDFDEGLGHFHQAQSVETFMELVAVFEELSSSNQSLAAVYMLKSIAKLKQNRSHIADELKQIGKNIEEFDKYLEIYIQRLQIFFIPILEKEIDSLTTQLEALRYRELIKRTGKAAKHKSW